MILEHVLSKDTSFPYFPKVKPIIDFWTYSLIRLDLKSNNHHSFNLSFWVSGKSYPNHHCKSTSSVQTYKSNVTLHKAMVSLTVYCGVTEWLKEGRKISSILVFRHSLLWESMRMMLAYTTHRAAGKTK